MEISNVNFYTFIRPNQDPDIFTAIIGLCSSGLVVRKAITVALP
jgi:hypothetical protein